MPVSVEHLRAPVEHTHPRGQGVALATDEQDEARLPVDRDHLHAGLAYLSSNVPGATRLIQSPFLDCA